MVVEMFWFGAALLPHSTKEWLKRRERRVVEWPSQSPDLNPTEMPWEGFEIGCTCKKPLKHWTAERALHGGMGKNFSQWMSESGRPVKEMPT